MTPTIRWTHRLAGLGMAGLILTWVAAAGAYAVSHRIPKALPWCGSASLLLFAAAALAEFRRRP